MSEPKPGAFSAWQVLHGRHEIMRGLKAGGMGAVYECIRFKTQNRRVLEAMLPQIVADAGLRSRFEFEPRVTADIESDHLSASTSSRPSTPRSMTHASQVGDRT